MRRASKWIVSTAEAGAMVLTRRLSEYPLEPETEVTVLQAIVEEGTKGQSASRGLLASGPRFQQKPYLVEGHNDAYPKDGENQ